MHEKLVCPDCGAAVPRVTPAGHCPACLMRFGLSVADGGLAFGLDEIPAEENPAHPLPAPESKRVRHVGDYELIEEIGRGGMGVVYKARQVSLNRFVALKLVRSGDFADEREIVRFRSEAESAAHLDHPNIVPIYEVGEDEGRHYFSMKLIEGGSLAGWSPKSKVQGPKSVEEVARLMATIARAVHYAHQRGLLHRDLKPGNILLDSEGRPHIADFGLAKSIETDSAMTLPGVILGTPGYIAPEQAAGLKQLTTAADVYSLGAVLYELLAGRPPFTGSTVMETLRKVMSEEPVPPSRVARKAEGRMQNAEASTRRAKVHSSFLDLETICLKCLEKDPARRYGSAEGLADDLERWLRHEPIRARPATLDERFTKWTRRNPLLTGSLAAVFIVTFLGLGGIVWQWRNSVAATTRAGRANDQFWQSAYLGTRYWTRAGAVGQRSNALALIETAAALRPSLELRNEMLGALLLPEMGPRLWWKAEPGFEQPWAYDTELEHYVPHQMDQRVVVSRVSDHRIARDLGTFQPGASCARFSPDGRYVAAEFDRSLITRVWDWRAGELRAEVRCSHFGWGVVPFCFSSDGRELIYADDKTGVSRVDLASGRPLSPLFTNHLAELVRLSPSGRRLLVTRGKEVEAWELQPLRLIAATKAGATGKTTDAAWHPNEDTVALLSHEGGFLWSLPESELQPIGDPKAALQTGFFNPTGDLLFLWGYHGYSEIWDVAAQQPLLGSLGSLGGPVALSRDGSRLALNQEKVGFGVWEFLPPVGLRKFITMTGPRSQVRNLDLHPNGRWLLTGGWSDWTLWDVETARTLARDPEQGPRPPNALTAVKFSRDGRAFHTCDQHGLRRWPLLESEIPDSKSQITVGKPEILMPGLPVAGAIDTNRPLAAQIISLAQSAGTACEGGVLSADGRSAALLGNGRVILFGLEPRALFPFVKLLNPNDNCVALSPDGRWLATTHNNQPGGPDVYDLREGRHVRRLAEAELAGVIWQSQTGELVTQSPVEALFWDPGSWTVKRRLPWPAPGLAISFNAFSPGGRTGWLNGPNGSLQLVDLMKGELCTTFPPPPSQHLHLFAAAFDAPRQRAYLAHTSGVLALDLAALRLELARLGLDWQDENPTAFVPRRK